MNEKKEINLSNIYIGKPDARDELDTGGIDRFIETFVMPPHFDREGMLSGEKCFITGYKGTGKTALLLYLEYLYKEEDPATCSSFLLFKSDYRETKRSRMAAQARRAVSTMVMDKENLRGSDDFSYLWRWHLFRQIIRDNERYNRGLFVDNRAWKDFEACIDSLAPFEKAKAKKGGLEKINLAMPFLNGAIKPEMGISFQDRGEEPVDLVEIIEEATDLFRDLQRTDTPYYIFVDELEANYGEQSQFERDLCLIRDLILEVKALNILFTRSGMKRTKIICAVRREVINSINRVITSLEINKAIEGFDCPLVWEYNLEAEFEHPLIQILLKRIEISEQKNGMTAPWQDLIRRWFPETGQDTPNDTLKYILNFSWFKPRDIVRLLTAAKSSPSCTEKCFTKDVLDDCMPEYSRRSLDEQREELRAIYNAREIDGIFACFNGNHDIFTMEEIRTLALREFPDSPLAADTRDVLENLYRLGILGNYIRSEHTNGTGGRYRFQYRGDDQVILAEPWELMVHRGLHKALSIRRLQNKVEECGEPDPNEGLEGILREIDLGTNRGIRGVLEDTDIQVTVSKNQLRDWGIKGCAEAQRMELRIRTLYKNSVGGAYSAEIIAAKPGELPEPGVSERPLPEGLLPCGLYPGDTTELTRLRTKDGRLRGIFLDGYEATVSAARLAGRSAAALCSQGTVLVRILNKNALGESYEAELAE